jgi:hypothetical protein
MKMRTGGIFMTTDEGIEIKDGGIVVDIPIEALIGILEQYPDVTLRLEK